MHDFPDGFPRIARRMAIALPLLALPGCAPNSAPEAAQAALVPGRTEMQETPICRADPALLATPSAPDCKFGRPDLKTLDPNQWARLKIEYERQCYQRAEQTVRERLRLLQAASRCESAALQR